MVEDLYKASEEDGYMHLRLDEEFYAIVKRNEEVFNSSIIYDRDFSYSYFAIKVILYKYLKHFANYFQK